MSLRFLNWSYKMRRPLSWLRTVQCSVGEECLEAEAGCLMLHSRGARSHSSALAAAERCESLFQAAEPWRNCAYVLFTVCW